MHSFAEDRASTGCEDIAEPVDVFPIRQRDQGHFTIAGRQDGGAVGAPAPAAGVVKNDEGTEPCQGQRQGQPVEDVLIEDADSIEGSDMWIETSLPSYPPSSDSIVRLAPRACGERINGSWKQTDIYR